MFSGNTERKQMSQLTGLRDSIDVFTVSDPDDIGILGMCDFDAGTLGVM